MCRRHRFGLAEKNVLKLIRYSAIYAKPDETTTRRGRALTQCMYHGHRCARARPHTHTQTHAHTVSESDDGWVGQNGETAKILFNLR